jgi:hypothetical protein
MAAALLLSLITRADRHILFGLMLGGTRFERIERVVEERVEGIFIFLNFDFRKTFGFEKLLRECAD